MNWIKRIGKNKILAHQKFTPLYLQPGDVIELSYIDKNGYKYHVLTKEVDEAYTLTEAMVFKVDDDDYRGIGGAFLETK